MNQCEFDSELVSDCSHPTSYVSMTAPKQHAHSHFRGIGAGSTHRFAPPASGLTMMLFRHSSMFLLMYEIIRGSE